MAKSKASAEAQLKAKKITLPSPAQPIANYVGAVRAGNLLFLSGHGGGPQWRGRGKVGQEVTLEQGYQSARDTGLYLLTTIRQTLGSLDKVKRIVKVSAENKTPTRGRGLKSALTLVVSVQAAPAHQ